MTFNSFFGRLCNLLWFLILTLLFDLLFEPLIIVCFEVCLHLKLTLVLYGPAILPDSVHVLIRVIITLTNECPTLQQALCQLQLLNDLQLSHPSVCHSSCLTLCTRCLASETSPPLQARCGALYFGYQVNELIGGLLRLLKGFVYGSLWPQSWWSLHWLQPSVPPSSTSPRCLLLLHACHACGWHVEHLSITLPLTCQVLGCAKLDLLMAIPSP